MTAIKDFINCGKCLKTMLRLTAESIPRSSFKQPSHFKTTWKSSLPSVETPYVSRNWIWLKLFRLCMQRVKHGEKSFRAFLCHKTPRHVLQRTSPTCCGCSLANRQSEVFPTFEEKFIIRESVSREYCFWYKISNCHQWQHLHQCEKNSTKLIKLFKKAICMKISERGQKPSPTGLFNVNRATHLMRLKWKY